MAFANVTDIVTSAIESRTRKIADNVTKNNALYARLKKKGKIKPVSGGVQIFQEISFAENTNAGWYSGYDQLPVAAQDVISAAAYNWKQIAVPVVISGLEQMQNTGKEAMFDLMEARQEVAEATMANQMSAGAYADGTGFGGKQLAGLGALVTANPVTGVVGGIDGAVFSFWRNQFTGSLGIQTAATIQGTMNALWVKGVRGTDRFDLIVFDNSLYSIYLASLQAIQRFTQADEGELGFPSVKYMDADVVLDGGIGGFETANVGHFLNTNYIFLRPHRDRDMITLAPNRRVAINQDAEVVILAWGGAFTSSGRQFQGYYQGS